MRARAAAAVVGLVVLLSVAAAPLPDTASWRHWRGPFETGMAVGDAPLQWSDSENVTWKVAIPGRGAEQRAGQARRDRTRLLPARA